MMVRYKLIALILLVFLSFGAFSQEGYPDRARNYVKQYAATAIADQKASGVPAAITLGQGILETEAGVSELVVKANNHFGIKCKNEWRGETFLHTDDAKDECFKKYKCAQESYNDHSAHLHRNPRYHSLFGCPITDYRKWAHGLKKCGYATNPRYAYELIKIIEEFDLQQYTLEALDTSSIDSIADQPLLVAMPVAEEKKDIPTPVVAPSAPIATVTKTDTVFVVDTVVVVKTTTDANKGFDEIAKMADSARMAIAANEQANASLYPPEEPIVDSGNKIIVVNGLKAIYCRKDEMLLQYAVKYNIRYPHLLEMNDLADEPLPFDSYIYLEKKGTVGTKEKHIVKPRETLQMVAQAEGIQLKKLASLNLMTIYEQPQGGVALQLQTQATEKPATETSAIKVYNSDVIADPSQETFTINTATLPDDAQKDTAAGQVAPATDNNLSEGVSFGMSMEGPKQLASTGVVGDKAPGMEDEMQSPQKQEDTTRKKTPPDVPKHTVIKDDPSQRLST